MTGSGTAQDGDAVKYMYMLSVLLNEKFTGIEYEVVADFVDTEQDLVTFLTYAWYVFLKTRCYQ